MSIFTKQGSLHAKDYLAVIHRRWRIVLFSFIIFVGSAVYVNIKTDYLFVATAQLMLNPDLPQALMGSVNPYLSEFNEDVTIQTQLRIIRSDPIAEGVVERLGLVDKETDPNGYQKFVESVKRVLEVERIAGTRLFKLTARSNKGQEAADIANAAAQEFIQQSIQIKFEASKRSVSWLTDQIIEMREKMEESEKNLLQYQREQNLVAVSVDPEIQGKKAAELQSQFITNQTRVNDLKIKIAQIKKLLSEKEIPFVPAGLSVSLDSLAKELSDQRLKLEKSRIEFRDKHPTVVRIQEEISIVEREIRKELGKSVEKYQMEFQEAVGRDRVLEESLNSLNRSLLTSNEKQIQLSILQREVETYRELYNLLIKKLKAADLVQGVGESNYRIVEYAKNPRWPVRPRKRRNVVFGVLLGITFGLFAAFTLEYFDRTIRTPEDLENATDLPVLVSIPKVKSRVKTAMNDSIFLTQDNQQSVEAVAFHALRTSVRFSSKVDGQSHSILVTSSTPSEGKTTIIVNLGISFALSGLKTLILDTDLRRPRIHTIFEVPNDRGISNCVPENLQDYVQKTPYENLDILSSGPHTSAPFEYLESDQMLRIIAKVKEDYDQILFDSPPVGSVVDASVLSTFADGVLFVLNSGKIESYYLKHAKEQLEKVNAHIFGVVLNNLDRDSSKYYYSYYYRGYYGNRTKEILEGIKDTVQRT